MHRFGCPLHRILHRLLETRQLSLRFLQVFEPWSGYSLNTKNRELHRRTPTILRVLSGSFAVATSPVIAIFKSESIVDDLECHRSSTRFAASFRPQVGTSTPMRRSECRGEMFGSSFGFVDGKWTESFASRLIRVVCATRGLNCFLNHGFIGWHG